MPRRLLDTSVLIRFWVREALDRKPDATVRAKARQLIGLHDTDAIATPVYLELVAGTMNRESLRRTRIFLGEFNIVDEWNVTEADWQEAKRLAERVPRNGRRRQMGDCLILAIANRLHYEVVALDTYF